MGTFILIAIIVSAVHLVAAGISFVTFIANFDNEMSSYKQSVRERKGGRVSYEIFREPDFYLERAAFASKWAKVSLAAMVLSPLAILVIPAVGIYFAGLGIRKGVQKTIPALKFEHS